MKEVSDRKVAVFFVTAFASIGMLMAGFTFGLAKWGLDAGDILMALAFWALYSVGCFIFLPMLWSDIFPGTPREHSVRTRVRTRQNAEPRK